VGSPAGLAVNADFASCHYVWDFGDPNAGAWSTTGLSKNLSIGGPTAAHVYETPGTYRATLTVTDVAGQVLRYSQDITVQDFTGTTYYISAAGSDSSNGTSTSTPWQTVSKVFSNLGANKRFLFKRGETFSTSGPKYINTAGPGIFGANGSGNKPVIMGTTVRDINTSHVLRIWQAHKGVITNNVLANPGGGNHGIKMHGPTNGDSRPAARLGLRPRRIRAIGATHPHVTRPVRIVRNHDLPE